MKWRWPPWRRRVADTSGEARAQLRRLEQRDAEVERLGWELREHQSRNHFSVMVNQAIARGAHEGP